MKKMICAAMAAAAILTLAACGSTSGSETQAPSTESSSTQTTTQTTPEATSQPAADASVFEEIVLADDENATVKVTAIDEDNFWGYTLKVYLENKTDKELMFTVESVSVNGFMCDPFWASSVAAGMKANEEISFSESDFDKNSIETVTDITFTLRVYDSNDWTAEDLINEKITVNP